MRRHRKVINIVLYCINGTGLGHITRQRNIGREMRTILRGLDIRHNIQVITTSDAPQVASEFMVTKIPSKTTVKELGDISSRDYSAHGRMIIGNILASIQPNLLVVDTDPRGSFGEVPMWSSYANCTAFIDRMKDKSVTEKDAYKKSLRLFDIIVVPEQSSSLEGNYELVGKIQGFLPERALPGAQVREEYGVNGDETFVYLSAGGGGDKTCQQSLSTMIEQLARRPKTVVLVGYGPLYRGPICHKYRNVIPTQDVEVSRYFAGFDLAISAGGYNTHEELLAACCPTLFYAQTKGLDRQDLRIQESVDQGWAGQLQSWDTHSNTIDPVKFDGEVNSFLDGEAATIRKNLLAREFPAGNVKAAAAMLKPTFYSGLFGAEKAKEYTDAMQKVVEQVQRSRVAARSRLF